MSDIQELLKAFAYAHLPPHLQDISRPFGELAEQVAARKDSYHKRVALERLLEAKDAAVRASL